MDKFGRQVPCIVQDGQQEVALTNQECLSEETICGYMSRQ